MEPWYKIVVPRKELREGRSLDPSEFAVHLDQIIDGTAPGEYRDSDKFFARTYFTEALGEHITKVLRRLNGETENTAPILSLITQFGGGKTHTLATLYHIVKSGEKARSNLEIAQLLDKNNITKVPHAKIAAFIGNSWDPCEGRETPWLDIAWQLAGEKGVRLLGDNSKSSAPGTSTLQSLFNMVNEPILILFDEVLNYIGRYPQQAEQFHSFIQNLTSSLTARNNAVAILVLPASPTEMTDNLYEWQVKIVKAVGRVGKPIIASDPGEIAEIMRRRLFEDIGRSSMNQAVARQYAKWVYDNRERLPPEFANFPEEEIRKKFEESYPFHPSTLTVFQRKWQSLPTFQQTRGTLVMLGIWISRAYKEGYQRALKEPLITLGSAPLGDKEFCSKVIEQLNQDRLQAAIRFDIAGKSSHAVALDKETIDTVGKSKLNQRIATALFIESCGGMVMDKAASLPDLRFAIGNPDVETTIIDTTVQALASRCYYLRQVGSSGWRFGYKPTLRKLHADRKVALNPEDVKKKLADSIKDVIKHKVSMSYICFPKESSEIPDVPNLRLVVLSPEQELTDEFKGQIKEWTKNIGQSPRQYPGSIIWLVDDPQFSLRSPIEDWMAWQSISSDAKSNNIGELEPSDIQLIDSELVEARDTIVEKIWSSYNKLLLWNGKEGALQEVSLGQMHQSEANSITAAIMARLRQESLLNREIGATYLIRNWPEPLKESGAWSLAGVRSAFFQGYLTRLENVEDALKQMLPRAVEQGTIGIGVGKNEKALDKIWFKEPVDHAEIRFDHETFLLLPARALQYKSDGLEEKKSSSVEGETKKESADKKGGATSEYKPVKDKNVEEPKIIEWCGLMPRDKWNLFSLKAIGRMGTQDDVSITVKVKVNTKNKNLVQQLNSALEELGLQGEFHQ